MVQLSNGDVRRYVGVASTVIGLVCYALNSSFARLYGDWNSFKICAYIVSSSILCLAILFPKAWQRIYHAILPPEARQLLGCFKYKVDMAFVVMIFTTVYSFYLDRKSKTKPDAYALISSAAFAATSLCMSKHIEFGFLDLMYSFCGLLVLQLMQINPLLGFVGAGFGCFLDILRHCLDDTLDECKSLKYLEYFADHLVPSCPTGPAFYICACFLGAFIFYLIWLMYIIAMVSFVEWIHPYLPHPFGKMWPKLMERAEE